MSSSYRRPFVTITGNASAKDDKRRANRGVRRKRNRTIKSCADFDELVVPHRLECAWNEIYSWDRDGAQLYQGNERYSSEVLSREYYRKLLRK